MELFHRFKIDISGIELPCEFNNPFRYRPHKLCVLAADEVRASISENAEWNNDAGQGKMFGVLVVSNTNGEIGYLAAYSGLLCGSNSQPFFVPAVFDMLSPDGYFKREESGIVSLNNAIDAIENSEEYNRLLSDLNNSCKENDYKIATMRAKMQEAKSVRDAKRAIGGLLHEEEALLVRESQYMKAEYKRLLKKCSDEISVCEKELAIYKEKIEKLKEERKERSAALQKWLFEQFVMLNARGERKNLLRIFKEQLNLFPPAGTGECAAPKLLQYAFLNGLQPLCMAEFWVGASPSGELRRDGCFYGSCKGKCEPVLNFMLQGLDVEDISLNEKNKTIEEVKIVYEDEYLLVVDKPSGMLSVPGLVGGLSLQELLTTKKKAECLVVHRLDMATSGLIVVAKSLDIYKAVQAMFAGRKVTKCYTALLDGVPNELQGRVELPIASDYMNRPLQMVDERCGKEAHTNYEVLSTLFYKGRECAVVALSPLTGRTHQLRVHCAHVQGLNTPIVGDELYGKPDERLMLHASHLAFNHPVTDEPLIFESQAEFINLN